MIDEVLHLLEAIAQELTVSARLVVGDLHRTTSTTTEAMRDGLPQETMGRHHQEDTMNHMMLEVLHLRHEDTIPTLEAIHMLDRAVHRLLEHMAAMAVVVVVATEATMIGHIRYV